jgi:hypothetical protein
MSMFLLPKRTIKRMEKVVRRFFWQGGKIKEEISFGETGKDMQGKEERRTGNKRPEENEYKPSLQMVVVTRNW